ncbi:hypothetical protein K402DRAFT_261794 [Aulographum hederae CBS 113979]|uniref:Uncharacterized protein n=1 Tax=Aulographum hederae CBS 113979 TaxID=1176131 RepID=A0A6G1H9L2_9PEZI|nr:hypothetical protein K402DRAFT_261794 [Aulographum hederae CBS 113979]
MKCDKDWCHDCKRSGKVCHVKRCEVRDGKEFSSPKVESSEESVDITCDGCGKNLNNEKFGHCARCDKDWCHHCKFANKVCHVKTCEVWDGKELSGNADKRKNRGEPGGKKGEIPGAWPEKSSQSKTKSHSEKKQNRSKDAKSRWDDKSQGQGESNSGGDWNKATDNEGGNTWGEDDNQTSGGGYWANKAAEKKTDGEADFTWDGPDQTGNDDTWNQTSRNNWNDEPNFETNSAQGSTSFKNKTSAPNRVDTTIKPYWSAWNTPGASSAVDERAGRTSRDNSPPRARGSRANMLWIAPEDPLYAIPEDLAAEKGVEHQVRPGRGAEYTHRVAKPSYLDTMDRPYAVFRFKYRSKAMLEKILGKPVEETEVDLHSLSKEQLIQELLQAKKAKANAGDGAQDDKGGASGGTNTSPATSAWGQKGVDTKTDKSWSWKGNKSSANAQNAPSRGTSKQATNTEKTPPHEKSYKPRKEEKTSVPGSEKAWDGFQTNEESADFQDAKETMEEETEGNAVAPIPEEHTAQASETSANPKNAKESSIPEKQKEKETPVSPKESKDVEDKNGTPAQEKKTPISPKKSKEFKDEKGTPTYEAESVVSPNDSKDAAAQEEDAEAEFERATKGMNKSQKKKWKAKQKATAALKPAAKKDKHVPAEEQPTSVEEKPAPADEKPAPADEKSAPADEKPALADEKPAPTDEKPVHANEEPSPVEEAVVTKAVIDEEDKPANVEAKESSTKGNVAPVSVDDAAKPEKKSIPYGFSFGTTKSKGESVKKVDDIKATSAGDSKSTKTEVKSGFPWPGKLTSPWSNSSSAGDSKPADVDNKAISASDTKPADSKAKVGLSGNGKSVSPWTKISSTGDSKSADTDNKAISARDSKSVDTKAKASSSWDKTSAGAWTKHPTPKDSESAAIDNESFPKGDSKCEDTDAKATSAGDDKSADTNNKATATEGDKPIDADTKEDTTVGEEFWNSGAFVSKKQKRKANKAANKSGGGGPPGKEVVEAKNESDGEKTEKHPPADPVDHNKLKKKVSFSASTKSGDGKTKTAKEVGEPVVENTKDTKEPIVEPPEEVKEPVVDTKDDSDGENNDWATTNSKKSKKNKKKNKILHF